MASLPMEEIEKKVGSRYALTVLAGKRARELRDGANRLVNSDAKNPIIIALQEILEGKIYPEGMGDTPAPVETPEAVLEPARAAETVEAPALVTEEVEAIPAAPVEDVSDADELAAVLEPQPGDETSAQEALAGGGNDDDSPELSSVQG